MNLNMTASYDLSEIDVILSSHIKERFKVHPFFNIPKSSDYRYLMSNCLAISQALTGIEFLINALRFTGLVKNDDAFIINGSDELLLYKGVNLHYKKEDLGEITIHNDLESSILKVTLFLDHCAIEIENNNKLVLIEELNSNIKHLGIEMLVKKPVLKCVY